MVFSDLSEYMNEPHSKIEILFGNPSSDKKLQDIEKYSIELDFSLEKMLLYDFEDRFTNQWFRAGREDIFYLMCVYLFNLQVKPSKITHGIYKYKGVSYPKIVIHDDYWDRIDTNGRVWINDEIAEGLGREMDALFDIEYVEFKRIRK